jgi:hypothetical protein
MSVTPASGGGTGVTSSIGTSEGLSRLGQPFFVYMDWTGTDPPAISSLGAKAKRVPAVAPGT